MVIPLTALYAFGGLLIPILLKVLHGLGVAAPILSTVAKMWSVVPTVPDPTQAPLTANHPIISRLLARLQALEAEPTPVTPPAPKV